MKKIFILTAAILSIAFLSSCESNEQEEVQGKLSIQADLNQMSRASKETFLPGDELGIFILNAEGNNYNDCDCSFNNKGILSGEWSLQEEIALSKQPGSVYAYFPYSIEVTDYRKIPIESTSQTDYLVATPTTVDASNSVATLRMQHILSLVKFTIKKDGYIGNGHITNITLQGTGLNGTFDATTGDITITKVGNAIYKGDFTLNESPLTIGLIGFPQVVTSTIALVTIDGEKYSYKLAPSTWERGKETTYTLGINTEKNTLVTIGTTTIDVWGNGGSYEGNLIADGVDIGTEI